MADDLNIKGQIDIDVKSYVRAIDEAIDANNKFGKAIGLTEQQIDAQDKKLNAARKTVSGATNDTRAQERALKRSEKTWDAQNRIYDDYLRHQERGTKSNQTFGKSLADNEGNLSRTRYALYDVASSYAAVSAAALGAVAATGAIAIQYETAFTAVERTTLDTAGNVSANIDGIRDSLLDLSEQIPVSFQEITRIASLGAQLGIAEADLASFTDTVAKFAATTNVSVDSAAQSFGALGELLNVPASEFDNLGSAIALVGVNSVATESEILSVATQIAGVAANAGLGAEYVVGLAGALSSLRVPAEQSRGALTRTFQEINRAVGQGGDELEVFGQLMGVAAEDAAALWEGDPEAFFDQFLVGLSRTENLTAALDALGLSELRVTNTLTRLSQNLDLVNSTQADANKGFSEATFLNDAFAVVLDDVSSQFQLLLNSVGRFLSVAGVPMLEFLRATLPVLTDIVQGFTEFAETGFGQEVFRIVGGLTALIGVLAAVRAIAALTTASVFAIVTASGMLGGTGVLASIGGMTNALIGLTGASTGAAASMRALGGAALFAAGKFLIMLGVFAIAAASIDSLYNDGRLLRELLGSEWGTGIADLLFVLNPFASIIDLITNNGERLNEILIRNSELFGGLGDVISGVFGVARDFVGVFSSMAQTAANAAPQFQFVADAIQRVTNALGGMSNAFSEQGRNATVLGMIQQRDRSASARLRQRNMQRRRSGGGGLSTLGDIAPNLDDATDSLSNFSGGLDDAGAKAEKMVRTLVDYASDLRSTFSRAFNIRFGSQLAVDEVANQWERLSDRIRQARLEIQGLTAQRDIKQYFLSVANAYGDELRAGVLRAEIAEINEKISETQAEASSELQGNSKAARQNRQTLTGLLQGYQSYITALAESGADQATLNKAVNQAEREFISQATALGFSRQQLLPYTASLRDMTTIINNMPRNITVTANADPAIQALNEYRAAADRATQSMRNLGSAGSRIAAPNDAALKKYARGLNILASIEAARAIVSNPNEPASRRISYADRIANLTALYNSGNYYTGGFTGRGGKYEPAGVVHKGEYVIPKSGVNQSTGLPYADALGRTQVGSRPASGGYSRGGFVDGGGAMMVELSPADRRLLAQAAMNPDVVVAVDSKEIARASANGAKQITATGGRLS